VQVSLQQQRSLPASRQAEKPADEGRLGCSPKAGAISNRQPVRAARL